MNQTLSVKQDELTHINKDNARLVTQLTEAQKQCTTLVATTKDLDIELKKQVQSESKVRRENDTLNQENNFLKVDVDRQQADRNTLEVTNGKLLKEINQLKQNSHKNELALAKLQVEVQTQKTIFSQLKKTKLELI